MRHYFIKMGAVGVGDEYLTEIRTGHYFHDAFHSGCVEFVEYVVKQQKRFDAVECRAEKIVLGQAQGYGVCLALAL